MAASSKFSSAARERKTTSSFSSVAIYGSFNEARRESNPSMGYHVINEKLPAVEVRSASAMIERAECKKNLREQLSSKAFEQNLLWHVLARWRAKTQLG